MLKKLILYCISYILYYLTYYWSCLTSCLCWLVSLEHLLILLSWAFILLVLKFLKNLGFESKRGHLRQFDLLTRLLNKDFNANLFYYVGLYLLVVNTKIIFACLFMFSYAKCVYFVV